MSIITNIFKISIITNIFKISINLHRPRSILKRHKKFKVCVDL